MNYIEVLIKIPSDKNYLSEILIAFLAELGFESFSEENNTLAAYITEGNFDNQSLKGLMDDYQVDFSTKTIQQQNWNLEWEKNFSPIVVDEQLAIKAPFHDDVFNTCYTIEIEPKMSFGTGHHATTFMMCKLMDEFDFDGSRVLDMGCGTGILAIYSSMKGAAEVTGIDIDEWAYENTLENAARNNINNLKAIKGDISSLPDEKYDYIFANINLNILKKDVPEYAKHLNNEGYLFLSGFFLSELPQITGICNNNGLEFLKNIEQDNWTACIFKKV